MRATQSIPLLPGSTTTVAYGLQDPGVLTQLAQEMGATVGHAWSPWGFYAYLTEQPSEGNRLLTSLRWGEYGRIEFSAWVTSTSSLLEGFPESQPVGPEPSDIPF